VQRASLQIEILPPDKGGLVSNTWSRLQLKLRDGYYHACIWDLPCSNYVQTLTVLTGLGANFIKKKKPKPGHSITLKLRGGGQKLSKGKGHPRPVPMAARSKA